MSGLSFAAGGPEPADTPPPAVQVDSAMGVDPRYARADHTHESRLQARTMVLTFDANGEAVYAFPKAYPAGVVPIVTVTAFNTRGAAFRYDASLLVGSVNNTQATIVITKTPRTIVVSLLGAVTNLFTNPADTVSVCIMSRAPS